VSEVKDSLIELMKET
jgi:chromosome segregation ATPase